MIGYKAAIHPPTKQRALVTLEIPENGKNNLNRTGVYDSDYAPYRCDGAKVVSVKDMETGEDIEGAVSIFGHAGDKKILYMKDEVVYPDDYTQDDNVIYGAGIHFYKTEEPARHIRMNKPNSGINKEWYDDGRLAYECFYKDGVLHGEYTYWFPNGTIEHRGYYDHGVKNGLFQTWFDNGNLKSQHHYVDDHLNGECIDYYYNGNMHKVSHYQMHKLNGVHNEWYYNGTPSCTANYKNGERHGAFRSYHGNGVPMEESYFMFGMEHGERKLYDDTGQLISNRCYRNGYICR